MRAFVTSTIFCIALVISSIAIGSSEFHLYHIAGGARPSTLFDGKRSIHFLTRELATHGPKLKQFVSHNFTNGLCKLIGENYFHSIETGKSVEVAIFSFSWGVPKALKVARCLDRYDVPIELIIALDPIPKGPGSIGLVPENVGYFFNLYSLEGGLASIVNAKRIRAKSPNTVVFNQLVPGKISHSDFDNGVQHCSLNLLYNWIEGYRMRPRPCEVR